jgi:uncharacterized membrane protein HdeD (DUF308 family)
MSDMASAASFKTKQRPWWLLLIEGILVTIVGAILLFADKSGKIETYVILVVLLGFYWLFRGIADLVSMFVDHTAWGWKLFMGIIGILAGGYILVHPALSAVVLPQIMVLVLGIWGLMQGTIMLIMAFQGGGWGAGILGGLAILFGLLLVGEYGKLFTGVIMLWTAAVFALFGGIAMCVRAIMQGLQRRSA